MKASSPLRRLYAERRQAGDRAVDAFRSAKVIRKFKALEYCGAVRLRVEDDLDFTPDDGNCCCDDPDCSAKTGPAYGLIAEYRTDWDDFDSWHLDDGDDSVWVHAESVWGMTGYEDVRDSAYTIEFMGATTEAFRDAWKARSWVPTA